MSISFFASFTFGASFIVCTSVLLGYGLLWCWYVGLGRRVSPDLLNRIAQMLETFHSEYYGFKMAAPERTFAFPAAPWSLFGGPRWLVALMLAIIALTTQILLI